MEHHAGQTGAHGNGDRGGSCSHTPLSLRSSPLQERWKNAPTVRFTLHSHLSAEISHSEKWFAQVISVGHTVGRPEIDKSKA